MFFVSRDVKRILVAVLHTAMGSTTEGEHLIKLVRVKKCSRTIA